MGKRFGVERGLVRLRPEEPGNPYVNVRARWDSQVARVYVDYAGVLFPINNDKLKFTSDPAQTQSEILALLIFGGEQYTTVAGGDASPGTGPGGVALGVGAGLV